MRILCVRLIKENLMKISKIYIIFTFICPNRAIIRASSCYKVRQTFSKVLQIQFFKTSIFKMTYEWKIIDLKMKVAWTIEFLI